MERTCRVGEVAGLTGVSVRTLHHYDQIGLLQPGTGKDPSLLPKVILTGDIATHPA